MNVIKTVAIDIFLEDTDRDESELKREINRINSQYHDIDDSLQFEPDKTYMCLGQVGIGDEIVLVSNTGRVFKLPYEEHYIIHHWTFY
ncbi:hypothetical protein PBI_SCTP2_221 [Salicola phage SCTP-2]|nr:hypothetical protein PBI_SCTP2_221 [Salicola phage SCTP-2]